MNILEKIVADKRREVDQCKDRIPLSEFEKSRYYGEAGISLERRLRSGSESGVIAEFKRRSPSKGLINGTASPGEVAAAYTAAGVSGMSVLTDEKYFGGSFDDFRKAREATALPLLRKDFIIDEFQVHESKSLGADVLLLIAANLERGKCADLARCGSELGLEILLEIHSESELDFIDDNVDLVGINNRDLKTFRVDIENAIRLSEKIGSEKVKIAESGLNDPATIALLRTHGFSGFLIGERFMKHEDPGLACRLFIESLQSKTNNHQTGKK